MNAIVKRKETELALKPTCDVTEVDMVLDNAFRNRVALYQHNVDYGSREWEKVRETLAGMRTFIAEGYYAAELAEIEQARTFAAAGQVRSELSLLIAAFPNAPKSDLKAYGALLAMDVLSKHPTRYGVAKAAVKLRQTSKFLPVIADVLAALEEAEDRLRGAERSMREIPEAVESLARQLADAEEHEQRRLTEFAERERRKAFP